MSRVHSAFVNFLVVSSRFEIPDCPDYADGLVPVLGSFGFDFEFAKGIVKDPRTGSIDRLPPLTFES